MPLLSKGNGVKDEYEALPITIVIPLERDISGLNELITCIFNQHYTGAIHVLIANYSGEKSVEEMLLRLERDFRHLKHTNIATTTHLIDREKLAISVGVKGARTEWVMLLDADSKARVLIGETLLLQEMTSTHEGMRQISTRVFPMACNLIIKNILKVHIVVP